MSFTAAEDLKSLLSGNVVGGLKVTDDGVFDISWTSGVIYDPDEYSNIWIAAGSETCTPSDTNYLIWTTGGTIALSLVTATSSEVLVATIICDAGDITSIVENGFMTSVNADRPYIILQEELNDILYNNKFGLISIGEEVLTEMVKMFNKVKEVYRILVEVTYTQLTGASFPNSPKILKLLTRTIRTALITTNNDDISRDYWYNIGYTWPGALQSGLINMPIEARISRPN